jgi:uncharacterized protein (TIGR01244 family)
MTGHCTNETQRAILTREVDTTYSLDERLTLAGQPQPDDWAQLAAEGYQVVINMRSDPARAATQQQNAEAVGLRYIHLPLPAYELEAEHLATFHAVMQAQVGRVFLHCRSATRVALMWLLERIVYNGWEQERAEAALRAAGYGEDAMETFAFCAAEYVERVAAPRLV